MTGYLREPWPGFDALPWSEDARAQAVVRDNPGGMTLEDVGALFGLTRERIRQIEVSALRKLRKAEAVENPPAKTGRPRGSRDARARNGAGSISWWRRGERWRAQLRGKHLGYHASVASAQAALDKALAEESPS